MTTFFGTSGNDTLTSTDVADTLIGGLGDDLYNVNNIDDVVIEDADAGIDTVHSTVTYTLAANVENLTLGGGLNIPDPVTIINFPGLGPITIQNALNGTGNELNNVISGTCSNNLLRGAAGKDTLFGGQGDDTLDGGTGNDSLIGGTGNDVYIVGTSDTIVEAANEGVDTVIADSNFVLGANLENLTLTGTTNTRATGNELANILLGNSGDNLLTGGAGNDSLYGGTGGIDTLVGGIGDDVYRIDDTVHADVIVEEADGGTDTVVASVSYTLGDHLENLTLATVLTSTGNVPSSFSLQSDSSAINGTGNALDNVITGNVGNNILDGAGGSDTLSGGLGNDTYIATLQDTLIESADGGTDTVQIAASYTLGANLENLLLTGTANLTGTGNSANNYLIGNNGKNVLNGGSGNDTLDGGLGNDTLQGGIGSDTYYVSTSDVIVEALGAGSDTAIAASSYTLSDNVEKLILAGNYNINGTGNALNNTITGNSGDNIISAGAGNDTLDGGTGNDTLIGGAGDDLYTVSTSDKIVEAADQGTDTVQSDSSYILSANLENLILTGSHNSKGTGNDLANRITGNNNDNVLDGGAGIDTLIGGSGNDTYILSAGDVVVETKTYGSDTVQADFSYVLTANVEQLILTGTADINGTATDTGSQIWGNSGNNLLTGGLGDDSLRGGAGNDTLIGAGGRNYLYGADGDDVIYGGDGVDILDGGSGHDLLAGGAGNDLYYIDGNDTLTENADAGIDTVFSSIDYTLGANFENLSLSGSARHGVGNALNNRIEGTIGNDTLDGGAGNDTLIGGGGDDLYIVSTSDRIVEYYAADGIDTAQSATSYTLWYGVENLILTGSANVTGTGNVLDNTLTGNAGNNLLNGATGNDTLTGGAGNDLFLFNTALNSTTNHDLITDFTAGDKLQLDHLIFTTAGSAGTLTDSFFKAGAGLTSGQDADDHIIYNTTTGNLYYDADGSGSGASVLFAQLGTTTHPSLVAAQIQVV